MTDRKPASYQNETPEDVATLYSWANLHGAKYRDFSASRAQSREKARLRVQEVIEEEHRRDHEEAEAQQAAETQQAAEAARVAEETRQAELAAQQAAHDAEWSAQQAAHQLELANQQAVQRAAEQAAQQAAEQAARQRAWQQPRPEHFSPPPVSNPAPPAAPYFPPPPQTFEYPGYAQPQAYRPAPSPYPGQPQYASMRKESALPPRNPWAEPEPREPVGRPAWLTSDRPDMPSQPVPPAPLPQAPEDALQGSRDRMALRWWALRGVFDGAPAPVEAVPAPAVSRAPAMAVFSLAGGVGKTSLVATLGRALSARGERVLLVDTAAFGLLPFFFGARDQRPGLLRTFSPTGASSDLPVQMVTIDPESLGAEAPGQETLVGEISKFARGVSRVIIDLATASGAITRRIMRMAPMVLVPVVPDMNSVVSVSSIDAFFEHNGSPAASPALPYYVLNQFDVSLPLHLDVREVLREQLGDRLLPFAIRRAPAMSEALAEGMTVMDYVPTSPLAEDFGTLAGWVRSLSPPVTTSYRGVRWSER